MTVLSSQRNIFLPLKAEIQLQEVTSAVTRLLVGQAQFLATNPCNTTPTNLGWLAMLNFAPWPIGVVCGPLVARAGEVIVS